MKKSLKKLALHRETLAKLDPSSIGRAAGGSGYTCDYQYTCYSYTCPEYCNFSYPNHQNTCLTYGETCTTNHC